MSEDETAAEEAREGPEPSRPWLQAIADAEKAFSVYQDKCDSVDKMYADLSKMADTVGDREFQIFWANLEVLKPSIYQRAPQPVVMPRHTDTGEVPRKASELIERVLEFDVEYDDLHETLLQVRDDLVMASRGVSWVLDNGHCIHVDRCDFVHEPARKWQEVGWVARRAYMTRDQGVDRFGEVFRDAKLEEIGNDREDDYKSTERKAQVWEIWSKTDGEVYWVTEGVDEILDEQPPLFEVKGFFPCPKPAYGTLERGTLKPVPDFVYYRDQVDEINELTARISSLAESLRLKGFYASGTSEVGEAIEAAMKQTDNKAILVPISNFAALGGSALKDSIVWLPVAEVAQVITSCIDLRKQLIADVYEITGLSDIMRGVTDAQETLGAQNLKAQFGSIRVREKQNEMVRVALDVLRIKAEIYAESYGIQDLMAMAGMRLPTMDDLQRMAQQAQQTGQPMDETVAQEQVQELLQSQRMRPFAMEVETDSTIAANEEAEKASRMEFLTAVGSFIAQAGPLVKEQPETAPMMAELMKFGVGAFRAGRDLGGVIDHFSEQVKRASQQQAQNQKPDPETMKVQAEAQKAQAEMGLKQQELQLKARELAIKEQEAASRAQTNQYDAQARMAMKQLELGLKARELGVKVDDQKLRAQQAEIQNLLDAAELELEATQERPVGIGNG